MSPPHKDHERLLDLLADSSSGVPLTDGKLEELRTLQAIHADVDPDSFDRAVAALHLALLPPPDREMPDRLRERVLQQAGDFFASTPRTSTTGASPTSSSAATLRGADERPGFLSGPWPGWWAAAAVLVLLLGLAGSSDEGVPTLEDVRSASDVVVASWSGTEDPGGQGVTGEGIWSNELQMGFMHFRGLAPNDPAKGQYQLWIFDEERPAEYPVDGGVFDSDGGDVLVPIDAKIAVSRPTLLAITYERPGGVVVSTRERLLLTGTPE